MISIDAAQLTLADPYTSDPMQATLKINREGVTITAPNGSMVWVEQVGGTLRAHAYHARVGDEPVTVCPLLDTVVVSYTNPATGSAEELEI